MCHYITAVLPATADVQKVRSIMISHGRGLEPLSNRSMEEQMLSGESYFLTSTGRCDCGTTLGFASRTKSMGPQDLEAQVQKLQRKGWSTSKIERWVAEKQRTQEAGSETSISSWQQNDDWATLLASLLTSGATPQIGLVLHWYSGPLSGRLLLKGREDVTGSENRLQMLGNMREDHLYMFSK